MAAAAAAAATAATVDKGPTASLPPPLLPHVHHEPLAAEDIVLHREYDVWYNNVWQVMRVTGVVSTNSGAVIQFRANEDGWFKTSDPMTVRVAPLGTYTKNPKLTFHEAHSAALAELKQAEAQLKAAQQKLALVEATASPPAMQRKLVRRSPSSGRAQAAAAAAAAPAAATAGAKRKTEEIECQSKKKVK